MAVTFVPFSASFIKLDRADCHHVLLTDASMRLPQLPDSGIVTMPTLTTPQPIMWGKPDADWVHSSLYRYVNFYSCPVRHVLAPLQARVRGMIARKK